MFKIKLTCDIREMLSYLELASVFFFASLWSDPHRLPERLNY
jgi:hypothetical protein